jgi:hypothetical protein
MIAKGRWFLPNIAQRNVVGYGSRQQTSVAVADADSHPLDCENAADQQVAEADIKRAIVAPVCARQAIHRNL